MANDISNVKTVSSTLRISREGAGRAKDLDLPEVTRDLLNRLKFDRLGYATIAQLWWSGERSGSTFAAMLQRFVANTEGDADLILTWDDGEFSGVRIRGGKMKQCDVIVSLAPET